MAVISRRLALALAVSLVFGAPLAAQSPAHDQANELAHELMSPFCPGKLLAECTSSSAGELREAVATRIAAGETKAAVKADLVRQYGKEILGAPEPEGLGLFAWIVPGLLGLAMAAGVGWKVARAAREGRAAGRAMPLAAGVSADAGVLAQLDDELRDLD